MADLVDSTLTYFFPFSSCLDEAGVLRSGRVMLSRPSSLLRPPPTPSRPSAISRKPVIGGRTPHPHRTRAEEGLSSCRDTCRHIPRSLRRRVLRCPLQVLRHLPWPSPEKYRLGSLLTAFADVLTTLQTSLHVADYDFDSPRFDADISTNAGDFTTEGLGASSDRTRTGKLSRPCRSVTS